MSCKKTEKDTTTSFIDNLETSKWSRKLKTMAVNAVTRISANKKWTGHIFTANNKKIQGIILYKKAITDRSKNEEEGNKSLKE